MAASPDPHVQATISMPSADLITYRFDQNDKKLEELKLLVTTMSATFATNERVNDLEKRLDNYTWYWRAVFSGLIVAIAGVLVALIQRR